MKRSNIILRSIYIVSLIAFLLVVINVFLVSVIKVHIRSNTDLTAYAENASLTNDVIRAKRGTIYSSDGKVVAQDIETYDVICYLKGSNRMINSTTPGYITNPSEASRVLSNVLNGDENEIYRLLTANENLYQVEIGLVGKNISKAQRDEILTYDIKGIDFRNSSDRKYITGVDFAPYLIGYAQANDDGKVVGKMGLEQYLNAELSGEDGSHIYQKDKHGYILDGMYEEINVATNGYDVYTTIDSNVQDALETSFSELADGASQAWGAVVEIDTGKILGWGQSPSFDLNKLDITDYNNYGSMMAYEPGSVFKSFIYAAAMDSGRYNGNIGFDSSRYYYSSYGTEPRRVYGDTYYGYIDNANGKNWGTIPLDYGLIYSSNVATSTLLSDYVGSDLYFDYVKKFGFFKDVDTDGISEVTGSSNFYISPADKLSLTFGQGSSCTMLQLLQAYTAIFGNGEMIKPYFIDEIVDTNNDTTIYKASRNVVDRVISESTAKQMQELLKQVVYDERGTAKIYKVPDVEIIAKTGTAEKMENGAYTKDEYINSVMLAFPADKPKYMIYYAFVYPYDYGNVDNTGAVKKLIRQVAMLKTSEEINKDKVEGTKDISYMMPNIKNKELDDALSMLDNMDNVYIIGDGKTVIDYYPYENNIVHKNSKILLLTSYDNIRLPDFKGWTRKDIIAYWNLSKLAINIFNYGVCVEQSIPPNTLVTRNDTINISMDQIESYIKPTQEVLEEEIVGEDDDEQ